MRATLFLTLVLLPASIAALGGCRLIDQRDFERAGTVPAAAQVDRSARLAAGRAPPMTTVDFDDLETDWQPILLGASRRVLGAAPDAQFDVVARVASQAGPEVTEAAARHAAAVASVLESDGVSADHLHLGARTDRGRPGQVVEVFVR